MASTHKPYNKKQRPTYFDEICANCGFTFGSHHAGTSPWPYNYCPGHENRMDWENNKKKTTFDGTGIYKKGGDK